MKFNWDFEFKWTPELKSTLVHALVGSIVGLVSSFLTSGKLALAMLLVFSWATGQAIQKFSKWQPKVAQSNGVEKYQTKWWLGNGFYPFLIFWLFCWVLFYNIL
jgi:ABC-type branched-subunit amino acid transport system permease subunit